MRALNLGSDSYYDKVYGCWVGKNAGGTLGTPLEKAYGEAEPFDVWWYPELREGGLPNDDLEIQLIWLKALEEVGPQLTAADLAEYWLDHVGYNFDEYGLSKTNLRLGLQPPVSGHVNNWFIDCMGCPIRSEIWACVAPGAPRIAARYAYADGSCDHAGGESIYGELFNVALQSAGFVVDDPAKLIDIGLSYVPDKSQTALAIRAAVEAHEDGVDWIAARRRVLDATPHYVAQYSPINLGFQVIGLLYGTDFGDGICKTVNCGYDTDSSGASIGSYLGILAGSSGLPAKWTEPLGDSISTNESWGGVRHLSDGANPAPSHLDELVQRITAVARKVLSAHGVLGPDGVVTVAEQELYADAEIARLRDQNPLLVTFPGTAVDVGIEYGDAAHSAPGSSVPIVSRLTNRRADPLQAKVSIDVPVGWQQPEPVEVTLEPGATVLPWELAVPGRSVLADSNRLQLRVEVAGRPARPDAPLTLIGAAAYRVSGPYPLAADADADAIAALDRPLEPETLVADPLGPAGRPGRWRDLSATGNAVPLDDVLPGPGIAYLQTFLHTDTERAVYLGVDTSCPNRVWLRGEPVAELREHRPIRPSYGGAHTEVTLTPGWNEVLIKVVTDRAEVPDCHLLVCSQDVFRNGSWDLGRTRLPWD